MMVQFKDEVEDEQVKVVKRKDVKEAVEIKKRVRISIEMNSKSIRKKKMDVEEVEYNVPPESCGLCYLPYQLPCYKRALMFMATLYWKVKIIGVKAKVKSNLKRRRRPPVATPGQALGRLLRLTPFIEDNINCYQMKFADRVAFDTLCNPSIFRIQSNWPRPQPLPKRCYSPHDCLIPKCILPYHHFRPRHAVPIKNLKNPCNDIFLPPIQTDNDWMTYPKKVDDPYRLNKKDMKLDHSHRSGPFIEEKKKPPRKPCKEAEQEVVPVKRRPLRPVIQAQQIPEPVKVIAEEPVVQEQQMPEPVKLEPKKPVVQAQQIPEPVKSEPEKPVVKAQQIPEPVKAVVKTPVVQEQQKPEPLKVEAEKPVVQAQQVPEEVKKEVEKPVLKAQQIPAKVKRVRLQPVEQEQQIPEEIKKEIIQPIEQEQQVPEAVKQVVEKPVEKVQQIPEPVKQEIKKPVIHAQQIPEPVKHESLKPDIKEQQIQEPVKLEVKKPVEKAQQVPEPVKQEIIKPVAKAQQIPEQVKQEIDKPVVKAQQIPEPVKKEIIEPEEIAQQIPERVKEEPIKPEIKAQQIPESVKQEVAKPIEKAQQVPEPVKKEVDKPVPKAQQIPEPVKQEVREPVVEAQQIPEPVKQEVREPVAEAQQVPQPVKQEIMKPVVKAQQIPEPVKLEAEKPVVQAQQIPEPVKQEIMKPVEQAQQIPEPVKQEITKPAEEAQQIPEEEKKEVRKSVVQAQQIPEAVVQEATKPIEQAQQIPEPVKQEVAKPIEQAQQIPETAKQEITKPIERAQQIPEPDKKEIEKPVVQAQQIPEPVKQEVTTPVERAQQIPEPVKQDVSKPIEEAQQIPEVVKKEVIKPVLRAQQIPEPVKKEVIEPIVKAQQIPEQEKKKVSRPCPKRQKIPCEVKRVARQPSVRAPCIPEIRPLRGYTPCKPMSSRVPERKKIICAEPMRYEYTVPSAKDCRQMRLQRAKKISKYVTSDCGCIRKADGNWVIQPGCQKHHIKKWEVPECDFYVSSTELLYVSVENNFTEAMADSTYGLDNIACNKSHETHVSEHTKRKKKNDLKESTDDASEYDCHMSRALKHTRMENPNDNSLDKDCKQLANDIAVEVLRKHSFSDCTIKKAIQNIISKEIKPMDKEKMEHINLIQSYLNVVQSATEIPTKKEGTHVYDPSKCIPDNTVPVHVCKKHKKRSETIEKIEPNKYKSYKKECCEIEFRKIPKNTSMQKCKCASELDSYQAICRSHHDRATKSSRKERDKSSSPKKTLLKKDEVRTSDSHHRSHKQSTTDTQTHRDEYATHMLDQIDITNILKGLDFDSDTALDISVSVLNKDPSNYLDLRNGSVTKSSKDMPQTVGRVIEVSAKQLLNVLNCHKRLPKAQPKRKEKDLQKVHVLYKNCASLNDSSSSQDSVYRF